MKHIKLFEQFLSEGKSVSNEDLENENLETNEGRNEFLVAKELAKIAKMDVDRADSVVSGFINGTKDLVTMRKYWNAKDDKAAAMIVKKYWLD
jgi:hypothetical protein